MWRIQIGPLPLLLEARHLRGVQGLAAIQKILERTEHGTVVRVRVIGLRSRRGTPQPFPKPARPILRADGSGLDQQVCHGKGLRLPGLVEQLGGGLAPERGQRFMGLVQDNSPTNPRRPGP